MSKIINLGTVPVYTHLYAIIHIYNTIQDCLLFILGTVPIQPILTGNGDFSEKYSQYLTVTGTVLRSRDCPQLNTIQQHYSTTYHVGASIARPRETEGLPYMQGDF